MESNAECQFLFCFYMCTEKILKPNSENVLMVMHQPADPSYSDHSNGSQTADRAVCGSAGEEPTCP